MLKTLAGLFLFALQAAPPSTDVFLVEMTSLTGARRFTAPINITKREGYDNQPMFLPDGTALFYTSIREGRATDIYKYTIDTKQDAQVTDTPDGEYSATVMPGAAFFSVIRVEADSTQRLWKFPINGGSPSLVLQNIKPVGYHAWIDEKIVALFVLGEPPTLQIVDVPTQKAEIVAENIGRSLHKIPRERKVSFVHKLAADNWVIKSYDPASKQTSVLTKTLPGKEDYAWIDDGRGGVIMMASGAKLFFWLRADETWREVADFSSAGIRDITRLAVSPKGDRIAFVAATAQ